jgi:hypothetical protein
MSSKLGEFQCHNEAIVADQGSSDQLYLVGQIDFDRQSRHHSRKNVQRICICLGYAVMCPRAGPEDRS